MKYWSAKAAPQNVQHECSKAAWLYPNVLGGIISYTAAVTDAIKVMIGTAPSAGASAPALSSWMTTTTRGMRVGQDEKKHAGSRWICSFCIAQTALCKEAKAKYEEDETKCTGNLNLIYWGVIFAWNTVHVLWKSEKDFFFKAWFMKAPNFNIKFK